MRVVPARVLNNVTERNLARLAQIDPRLRTREIPGVMMWEIIEAMEFDSGRRADVVLWERAEALIAEGASVRRVWRETGLRRAEVTRAFFGERIDDETRRRATISAGMTGKVKSPAHRGALSRELHKRGGQ